MSRSERAQRVGRSLLAVAVLSSCDGKLIHLGDGRAVPEAGSSGIDASVDNAPPPCEHGAIAANEVLWIGDGWITIPGVQVTDVAAAAQASGAIGPNDQYVIAAAAGASMSAIASQYSAKAAANPKILIMDGGTIDTIATNGSDASVKSVASTFAQFLDQVARDGSVKHIIYFLVPQLPKIFGVAALGPLLQQACTQSRVPCHFIDLQDLQPPWIDHPEYTMDNGILPTVAGAKVIASAIWSRMQQSCIAQ